MCKVEADAGDALKVLRTHCSCWETDRFSLGAYSYFRLGTQLEDPLALAAPAGALLWAGEATDQSYQGAVHAALLSGKRAAQEAALLL